MKLTKKTAMLLSFTLGTLLLATTVLADITTKSGYDQLKDALKVTAEKSSETFNSFTMDVSFDLKDNGKTLMTTNEITKYDKSKGAMERISSDLNLNGDKSGSLIYSDTTTMIRLSDSDPTYYVTEYTKGRKGEFFSDPFKDKSADDAEKIVDALVGNLKDNVVVTENSDGTKVLSGSLSEVQIPSLINALASFKLKQDFNNNQQGNLPHLTKDVFVKSIEGTAQINKDGVMESILGSAVLSGKDENGTAHDLTLEVLGKLTDINSTGVTKPDLSGKKVEKDVVAYENSGPEILHPEKFSGKFKNDILIEQDDKFVKAGERILEITQINNESAAGHYYEVYKPGFEEYAASKQDFSFTAQKSGGKNSPASDYDYTTDSGKKGNFFLDEHAGKIFFNPAAKGGLLYDSTFSPDLD
ncbi:hypothetical protein REC12_17315 [Desulfosporosinus sp. PR]|uniref:hypothetical protein n=1 Tax=Candidatus Desulfosporosinus nitrosoreducens TaxID=3401928 RepID=UPI0027FF73EE|nr:hypothetical protein [Desulfosporosinus sp. PR]MDQ7095353.1 hypothetical protein [Desulfosporosinus sp. PR]